MKRMSREAKLITRKSLFLFVRNVLVLGLFLVLVVVLGAVLAGSRKEPPCPSLFDMI